MPTHISMTTRARDFKFAGAIVQRLYLVMVVLTKNRLSTQYGWFCHGRSHIDVIITLPWMLHANEIYHACTLKDI